MPHQIADEPAILVQLLGPTAVGDAGRLHHGRIVAHVIDDADEAMIEHRQRLEQQRLQGGNGGTPRLEALRLRGLDIVRVRVVHPPLLASGLAALVKQSG